MFDTPALRRCLQDRFYPGDILEKTPSTKKLYFSRKPVLFSCFPALCIEGHVYANIYRLSKF